MCVLISKLQHEYIFSIKLDFKLAQKLDKYITPFQYPDKIIAPCMLKVAKWIYPLPVCMTEIVKCVVLSVSEGIGKSR